MRRRYRLRRRPCQFWSAAELRCRPKKSALALRGVVAAIPHSRVHLRFNPTKMIQKVFQRNLLLFLMLFNILKVPFILTIGKGSFQDGVQDGCRELNFSISKALFNIHKSFWCQTLGFKSSFNILNVPFLLIIRKGLFSRWRPRWLPRAKLLYIQGII